MWRITHRALGYPIVGYGKVVKFEIKLTLVTDLRLGICSALVLGSSGT